VSALSYDRAVRWSSWRVWLSTLIAVTSMAAGAHAQDRPVLHVSRATTPPKIDGVLDDAVWLADPLPTGTWLSYSPLRGDPGPERTEVRITYDERFIYFAFRCLTDQPKSVRTTLSKRDSVFNDDWVGFSLDSTGSRQSSYHLMVNPSGVQMDAINTTAGNEKFESDFVWYSAGSRTSDGYVVEVALPLQTVRFSAESTVTMGVLFWRHVSQSGVSYSWPDMPSGQWVFDRHAQLEFDDLMPRRLFELLPSVTWPMSQLRTDPETWSDVSGHPELGISGKYGITSEITADGTINPDFSQVESDAFQVHVNQRFPTFFSEKRPFFMEGLGLFSMAGTADDFNMRSAVHTRRIVNPSWGAKLTGTSGPVAFGVLSASDETPEGIDSGTRPDRPHKLFTIGRATYGFGGSNYVGALVTDTEIDGRRNSVLGADVSWKPSISQTVSATSFFTQTSDRQATDVSGAAGQVSYRYDTRRLLVAPQLEHYDQNFRADTAFYNRTGFTAAFVYSEVNFYPESVKRIGLIRIHPLVVARYGHDDMQGGDEGFVTVGSAFNFSRQGFLRVQHGEGHEPWAGQRFRSGQPFGAFGNVQLFRWLHVGANFFYKSWATFYDPVAPFQGRSTNGGFEVTWQPTVHFSQNVSYDTVRFSRADTGVRVFTVDIVNAKSIYQFNTRFFVRLQEQFDSSRHQLLTDLLASYEVVPGTVLHAGYGSLYEQRDYQDGRLIPNTGQYQTVSRGLFLKASYLYRF
jgi:hypothetical protein